MCDMLGTNLEQMEHNPYLGVEVSAGLEWKHHVKIVSGKAHRTLNFLQRNMYRCPTEVRKQAYISLIRPTLEYASTCWDPCIKIQITALESVQRKAARFIANDHRKTTSVTALLDKFELPTLQQRREASRLSMMYKIHHKEVAVSIPEYYTPLKLPLSRPGFIIQTVVQANYCSANVLFSLENDEFNGPVCLCNVLRNWPFALKWHFCYSSIFKDTMSHRNG